MKAKSSFPSREIVATASVRHLGAVWFRARYRNANRKAKMKGRIVMNKVLGSRARLLSFLMLTILAAIPAAHAQLAFYNIPSLAFTAVANGPNPLPQVVTVASTGVNMNFTATPSTFSGGNWLTTTPTGINCCVTPDGV